MRKLASVQRVKELIPIQGADFIELAVVLGWQVVVKRGEFKVGDLACYVEIDAFVPHDIAPFLTEKGKEPKEYKGIQGQRLKTKKLKKQLSQGLLLPLNVVAERTTVKAEEGMDVTDVLGIQKWEAPEEFLNGSQTAGSSTGKKFPAFIRKTDQTRIQSIGEMVERAMDEVFEVTLKRDGSSLTVFRVDPKSPYYEDARSLTTKKLNLLQRAKRWFFGIVKGKEAVYGICSRNLLLKLDGSSNFHMGVYKYNLLDALYELGGSYALQLELTAPDIQGNHEKVEGVEVHLFDIFDIDKQEYVLPAERHSIASDYGIPHITVLATGKLRDIIKYGEGDNLVHKLLDHAEGPSDSKGVMREGCVWKSAGRDFSFKCVSNSYLLKTGK